MGVKSFPAFPVKSRIFGGAGATPEDKKQTRDIVTRFMAEAKAGEAYAYGSGVGSSGGGFEIVPYNRSPNKLGIRSGGRTVALSRTNAAAHIKNGVTLIPKSKSKR